MKILICANNDVGLYNFRKDLIKKLIEMNNELHISLPYGRKVEGLKRECKIVCVKRNCTNLLYAPYWGNQS